MSKKHNWTILETLQRTNNLANDHNLLSAQCIVSCKNFWRVLVTLTVIELIIAKYIGGRPELWSTFLSTQTIIILNKYHTLASRSRIVLQNCNLLRLKNRNGCCARLARKTTSINSERRKYLLLASYQYQYQVLACISERINREDAENNYIRDI